jgi:hypothetical protein
VAGGLTQFNADFRVPDAYFVNMLLKCQCKVLEMGTKAAENVMSRVVDMASAGREANQDDARVLTLICPTERVSRLDGA